MIKLIVAKASNNIIGKDNDLIWHLPADMRFFTQSTKGHIVIMGRKNWDSIPLKYRPLSDRINAVITRNTEFSHPDCDTFNSIEAAIEYYQKNNPNLDIYIIGGGQIYDYSIKNNLIDEMLITYIDHSYDGDTWFPDFDESNWNKSVVMEYKKDEKNPHDFTVYSFLKKYSQLDMRTYLITLLLILVSTFGFSQSTNQLAVDFIYELDSVPVKAYNTYLDQSFKEKVELEQMVKMWGQIETMLGNFKSSNYICIDTTTEYTQVFVNVKFKRKEQDLNISFNDSSKIVGFFMAASIPCQPTIYPFPKYVKEKKFTETNIQFESEGLKMYGSLTLPNKIKKGTSIFIFVHGSGPNDRDETVGPNKIFKDLAYGLATKGIPSLRYDKRAYVHKTLALNDNIHKEVLNDVTSAIKWIKTQDNIKDNPIYIIGHSLGAYLAPLIVKNNAEVKGLVMMAGNCRPLEDLILEQYKYIAKVTNDNSEEMKKAIADIEVQINYLKNNLTVDSPPEKLPLGMPASYWLSLKTYHQKEVIKNLTIPIFVMQGERDYQVTMEDYKLWNETMAEKPNYTAKSYEKLNHLFLEGEGKPNPDEYMTQSNVPKYVLVDIVKWIKENT